MTACPQPGERVVHKRLGPGTVLPPLTTNTRRMARVQYDSGHIFRHEWADLQPEFDGSTQFECPHHFSCGGECGVLGI